VRLRNALRIGAVAASTAATAAVLFGASPASAAGTDVRISPQSAPGTEIAKASASASFSSAVLRTDGPFTNQTWTMQQVADLGGGRLAFTYTNKRGGCLDVNADSKKDGEALVVKTCDGTLSQQWVRNFSVNATFLRLENRNSGLFATAEGNRIIQRAGISSFSQFWSVLGA
jgi:hypothetical protein